MNDIARQENLSSTFALICLAALSCLTGCPSPGEKSPIQPGRCFITMPDKYIEYYQVRYYVPDSYDPQQEAEYFRSAFKVIPNTLYDSDGYEKEKKYYAIILVDLSHDSATDAYKCGAIFKISDVKEPAIDWDTLISNTPVARSPVSLRDKHYLTWDFLEKHAEMRNMRGEEVLEK